MTSAIGVGQRHVLCIIGTRPEAIKMAPVIRALRATNWARVTTMVSGQHRELLRQALATFAIEPDADLEVMTDNQTLGRLSARLFERLEPAIGRAAPDCVLAQGDTTTVMVTSVICHYLGVRFGHVEAGLRSGNLRNPFPEEMNRIVAGAVADLHFAPTPRAAEALRREGAAAGTIVLTGNTVIDALKSMLQRPARVPWPTQPNRRLILLTAHRRESFGAPLRRVLAALREAVLAHDDIELVFPVHPNPAVQATAQAELGESPRIHLVGPLPYELFVATMQRAHVIISDSGGVQEEAPALGKPVLVIRDETERPEAVAAGVARLVGANGSAVRRNLEQLLSDAAAYRSMARGASPYGDGRASARIVDALEVSLGLKLARTMSDWCFDACGLAT